MLWVCNFFPRLQIVFHKRRDGFPFLPLLVLGCVLHLLGSRLSNGDSGTTALRYSNANGCDCSNWTCWYDEEQRLASNM